MKYFHLLVSSLLSIATLAQTDIAFHDDFNDNKKNWNVNRSADMDCYVENGHYVINHKRESGSWYFWKYIPIDEYADFVIEAKIRLVSGVENNGFGLIWGTADVSNTNMFTITANGYFKIAKSEDGSYKDIQKWKSLDNVNPKNEYNTLKVHKIHNTLYYYLNGQRIYSSRFSPFFGHYFGFIVYDKMRIEVDYLTLKQDGMALNEVKYEAVYEKEHLGDKINSKYSEIMPRISPDGKTLYLARKDDPKNTGGDKNDDIWVSYLGDDGSWSELENIGKPLNNTGHNDVISVPPDGNSLILMNTYNSDGSPGSTGMSRSVKTKKGWSLPKTINIKNYYNNSSYSEFCLSSDNQVLLMTIERNDTYGAKDVYFSIFDGEEFSEPMNLGPVVNTFGNEVSPFLASDNVTLYYSTNGKTGYGDNDIFVTKRLDDTWTNWSEPKNLGPAINTQDWDAYYTVPASGDYAYLISQENSLGKGDVFRIKIPEEAKPEPVVLISGVVRNSVTKDPMEANIIYNNLRTDEVIGTAISDPVTGQYKIVLPYGKIYSFRATQAGFYPVSDNMNVEEIDEYVTIEKDLILTPVKVGETIRLNNIFFDVNKSTLKEESYSELNRLISFMNDNPKMKISIGGHTDSQGEDAFNLKLSQDRVKSVIDYLLSKNISSENLAGQGYGETQPIASNDTEEGRGLNRRVEFTIVELK